jgi:hypothetical protein
MNGTDECCCCVLGLMSMDGTNGGAGGARDGGSSLSFPKWSRHRFVADL